MSIKLMSEVWEKAPVDGSALLLLLALADRASDEGVCWPSIKTLATKTRRSRSYTIELLAKLEHDNLIKREHRMDASGDQTSNLYRVFSTPYAPVIDVGSQPQPTTPSAPVDPGSQPQPTRVVSPSLPNTSLIHHSDSPIKPIQPPDDFEIMQRTIERMLHRPQNAIDMPAIKEFVENGVTEDDIGEALLFFSKTGNVAYGAKQIKKSVMHALLKRTQGENARPQERNDMYAQGAHYV